MVLKYAGSLAYAISSLSSVLKSYFNQTNVFYYVAATAKMETQFVEDAVRQLLKARRVLKCSYIYGYYLDGPGYKKIVFELMQVLF